MCVFVVQLLREPLQRFIRERLLQNEAPTAENIERGVAELVTECGDSLETAAVRTRPLARCLTSYVERG